MIIQVQVDKWLCRGAPGCLRPREAAPLPLGLMGMGGLFLAMSLSWQ